MTSSRPPPLARGPWHPQVLGGVPLECPAVSEPGLLVGLTDDRRDYSRSGGSGPRDSLRLACGATMLVTPHQVHGAAIHHVDGAGMPPECDALLVDRPGILAAVLGADCPGFLLATPRPNAFLLAHSGWRGTAAGLAGRCVDRLVQHERVPAAELRAWIGVGIGMEAYEVDDPVIKAVLATLTTTRSIAQARYLRATRSGHAVLDLPGIIALQLMEAGLDPAHINMRGGCTHAEKDRFHSFRRDGKRSGRHLLFGMLQPRGSS